MRLRIKDMYSSDFDETFMNVTKYEVIGKLPDPFLMDDGTRTDTLQKWSEQRKKLYKFAVELQYGTLPPKPEFVDVDILYKSGKSCSYKITTGTKRNPVSFYMKVILPNSEGPHPAIIDGDMCFMYSFNKEFINTITDNDIMLVLFDRTELAHDIREEGSRKGQLYNTYPEYTFGALGAWAWGYSRCVDALEKLGIADMSCIAFTGHSRGGKTAALAGVIDERAAIVNPNASCAGACGCYRIHMQAEKEDGSIGNSEKLCDILNKFTYWFGPELAKYKDRESELPFDCHWLKALVAPRILFVSEAASDIWSNPIGSWQTTIAAGEVYKFLGAENNLYWYFRKGYHFHDIQDIAMLVNIIRHTKFGDPLSDNFYKTPFKKPEPIYDWKCPRLK